MKFNKDANFRIQEHLFICIYTEETEAIDSLDAEKHDIPLHTKEPNQDDLFVVSSKPRPSMDISLTFINID